MTDEIYSELRYDDTEPHVSIASMPGMKERTILLHGFSKAFAMTGFRLGYACGPAPRCQPLPAPCWTTRPGRWARGCACWAAVCAGIR